jgi:hypothetical protein
MRPNVVEKPKFQIIEIDIPGAGATVTLSKTTEVDHEEILGVALFKNGGSHGHGNFGLKIAGEEVFPDNFHAGIITLDAENYNIVLKDITWPTKKKGKGSIIQIEYREPSNGAGGKIYLYLFANKLEYQDKQVGGCNDGEG